MLKNKKIVLAITGSIAAYRAVDICRLFVKAGADVTVLITSAALEFIGPATFAGLTGRQPLTSLFGGGFSHLDTARAADIFLIAPATANIMAKLAGGIADDIVSTTALASDCPVIVCPAMNDKMWLSKITQQNVGKLLRLGYEIVGPDQGELACGDIGWGRLEQIDRIVEAVAGRLRVASLLSDKTLLVTAGPTREYIDPVRFISNPSSGKMGYAIAEEATRRGAKVVMISGPTALIPNKAWEFVGVDSASEMGEAVKRRFDRVDAVVMTAAVADHRFARQSAVKIDKDSWPATLKMVKNEDILADLGKNKRDQILVGFAAQTEELQARGREKLIAKNLDLMVATKIEANRGFGTDEIEAVLIDRKSDESLGLISKKELAAKILDRFTTPD